MGYMVRLKRDVTELNRLEFEVFFSLIVLFIYWSSSDLNWSVRAPEFGLSS